MAEARATVDRMKSIDPEAVPAQVRRVSSTEIVGPHLPRHILRDTARSAKPAPNADAKRATSARSRAAGAGIASADSRRAAWPPGQRSGPVLLTLEDQADASLKDRRVALADALELAVPNDESSGAISAAGHWPGIAERRRHRRIRRRRTGDDGPARVD
jgi:hypothetical protein